MGLFNDVLGGFIDGFVAGTVHSLRHNHTPLGTARLERLCYELDWSIDDRTDNSIVLDFKDPIIRTRKVFACAGDVLAAFACFSASSLPAREMPAEVLGYLLTRNAELTTGAWQVAINNGNAAFSVTYCALLAGLDANAFRWVCELIVRESQAFDAKMQAAGLL